MSVERSRSELVITRTFDAPRSLVFSAWVDSKRLAQWWGPEGFTNPVCEVDARPGGAIRVDMRAPDGALYPMTGVFEEVLEPERLVFTSGAPGEDGQPMFEIRNTVTFAERDGRTTVTVKAQVVRSTPAAAPHLEGMDVGWNETVDRLDAYTRAAGEDTADREIVITRLFDAPRERVFAAWTDPEHLARWWGPEGFTTTTHEMDFRNGGVWRFTMRGPGGVDYPNRIVYDEIAAPERLVYFHGGGGEREGPDFEATVTFLAEGRKTRLIMRSVFPTAAARDHVVKEYKAVEGGNQTLGRLAEYLASGAGAA
jgi:uncharacterized protein YndB with AHSA1/START domain